MEKEWVSLTDGFEGFPAEKTIQYSNTNLENGLDAGRETYASISYKLGGIWRISEPYDQNEGGVMYDLPEAGITSEVGCPMLVREGLYVTVPPGKKFSRLEVLSIKESTLETKDEILPVPEPVLENEEPKFIRDGDIYNTDTVYPHIYAECTGQEQVLGTECAHIYIYPMHYIAASKIIKLAEQIKIKVWFDDVSDISLNEKKDFLSDNIGNNMLSSMLLGYSDIYMTKDSAKPKMLIITTEELEYSMKIFEGVKTFSFDVKIVLTKEIYSKYPDKAQDEAIRTFLSEEYEKDKISYVVLGGDVNQIPTHKDNGGFASDSYYCTDGKTVIPRFALSRFPARTRSELNKQTDIASYYDRHYDEKIRHTAVFTTFYRDDYENCKKNIVSNMASFPFKIIERYDGKCKKSELINAINSGAAFINYRGHGSEKEWQSSIGLKTKDVPDLKVNTNTPIVLSIACSNNSIYVDECFGACWIRNEKAVAFLGASNPSYTTINHYYDKYLWEAIYDKKLSVIGDIYVWATLKLYQNHKGSYTTDTNIKEYLLLGDVSADYLANNIIHNN